MSLADSITSLASGTYTVTRTAQGTRSNGRYTPGSTSTFSIVASVQPMRGRDLRVLAEGQHAEDTRVIYTSTELRVMSPTNDPDRVSIDGESYELFRCERWDAFGETYYKGFASRVVQP